MLMKHALTAHSTLCFYSSCEKACEKLSVGKELEFHKWQGDVQELLKDAREKLNKLGEVKNLNVLFKQCPKRPLFCRINII